MSRLIERVKRAFLNREVIIHYDGEYWWAHDPDKEKETVICKHSVFDVLVEGIDEYFNKRVKERQNTPISEGN